MHESLTETFLLALTVVAVGHQGKVGIHAGIPAAESADSFSGVIIADVIALAGRAHEGAGTAGQTRFIKLLPFRRIEDLLHRGVFEII